MRQSVLLMIVRYSRYGSSGFILVGERSKSRPAATGDHMFFSAPNLVAPAEPWTISMHTSLIFLLPASVFDVCVIAGSMDSSIGKPRAKPEPRRKVRRDRC